MNLFFLSYSSAGYVKIVELLIEKGANVNSINEDGVSVLDAVSNATQGDSQLIRPSRKSVFHVGYH